MKLRLAVAFCLNLPSALLCAVMLTGCSKGESATSATPEPPAASPTTVATSSTEGIVGGKVPVANGASSIVLLTPEAPRASEEPGPASVMDQQQRTFFPEVVLVQAGTPVEFRNNDEEMHNINVKDSETSTQAFNVGLPPGINYRHTFEKEGLYLVTCDVHSGMAAQIMVTTTPYSTLSDVDGNFEIQGVMPGAYIVTVYAGAAPLEQRVEVTGGRTDVQIRRPQASGGSQ